MRKIEEEAQYMIELLRFLITILIAYVVGKLISKIKLPSILGWLITGDRKSVV